VLLTALVTMPVAVLVAVTTASGMTAPEASVMVPLRLALLDWPNTPIGKARANNNAIAQQ